MLIVHNNRALWYSFFAIIIISIGYLFFVAWQDEVPSASGFFGHTIGIVGFLLMLMTETLYSIRKRQSSSRWGRMSDWMDFHIFTGLVGPYLVFLHTSWKFNGLAGVVMLITIVVVFSGFFGRYVYTAIPRTVDGLELEFNALKAEIESVNSNLDNWKQSQSKMNVFTRIHTIYNKEPQNPLIFIFGRTLIDWKNRLRVWYEIRPLDIDQRRQAITLIQILRRRYQLKQQATSLVFARQLFAIWHVLHVPLGVVLFLAAFIHILAAFYYATLLH